MDWFQTISTIATVIGCAYYIHRDIKEDIKCQNARLDQQAARTDKLYEMFIDLLKEKRK